MGVGEPSTAKVRHGIVFPPNNIIEHPVAQILQRRADPKDVMIAANDPKRSVGLQHPAGSSQPIPAELVIGGKALKLIPVIVNGIYLGIVRPMQFSLNWRLYGGSANTISMLASGRAFNSSMQSPINMLSANAGGLLVAVRLSPRRFL